MLCVLFMKHLQQEIRVNQFHASLHSSFVYHCLLVLRGSALCRDNGSGVALEPWCLEQFWVLGGLQLFLASALVL